MHLLLGNQNFKCRGALYIKSVFQAGDLLDVYTAEHGVPASEIYHVKQYFHDENVAKTKWKEE